MSDKKQTKGTLEVVCGSMFSGKSEELIRRLRRATIAQQNVIVFKHAFDNRICDAHVTTHNGNMLKAFTTDDIDQIKKHGLHSDATVIGIDEVQFYSSSIIPVIIECINAGKKVIVAGLDCDFRGIPFGPIPALLALADSITKLHAICTLCGKDAHHSQRLVNGKPASFDEPIVKIGAQESYQARCRNCFIINKAPTYEQTENLV
jgi:thymidine kinase